MYRIGQALPEDREQIMQLYMLEKGREYCFWTDDYPTYDNVDEDLQNDALFVMKDEAGRVIAAVSIERDEAVDALSCWSPKLCPAGEIARLAVRPDLQGHGLAGQMVAHVMRVLKDRGFRGMHLIVNALNEKAVRAYRHFAFHQVGECDMYGQHFLCLEIGLDTL